MMRRLFAAIIASLLIVSPVSAADNVVSIIESDGRIVYNASDGLNDRFMVHNNMTPGETYNDYLIVRNDTSTAWDVYFKITTEGNDPSAEDLIDAIDMIIYIDGVEYYNGKARGKNLRPQGVDLTDAVALKTFAAGESVQMRVETRLSTLYSDVENPYSSRTHWHFYVSDELPPEPDPDEPVEPEEVIPNPRTEDSFSPIFFVILGMSVSLFIFVAVRERSEKKSHRLK